MLPADSVCMQYTARRFFLRAVYYLQCTTCSVLYAVLNPGIKQGCGKQVDSPGKEYRIFEGYRDHVIEVAPS